LTVKDNTEEVKESKKLDIEEECNIGKLKNWKEFLKFEGSFIAVICLELFWGRIDGIILSIFFNETQIATHYSWMNVVCFVDAFCYGWGVSICEMLSNLMIKKRIK